MVADLSVRLLISLIVSLLIGLTITGFLINGLFVNLRYKWRQFKVGGNTTGGREKAYKVSVNGYDSFIFQGMPNLLSALESRAIEKKGRCQRGCCGTCKLTVLSGYVHWLMPPGIKLQENEILACCCVPQSDLLLSKIPI